MLNSTRRRRAADHPRSQSLDELEANRARAIAEREGNITSQCGSCSQDSGCKAEGCALRKRGCEDGCTKCQSSTQPNQNGCTMKRECHGGCRDKCARPARLRFRQHKPKEDFKWKSINELRADEYKERLRLVVEEQNAREDAERNKFGPPPPPAIISLVSSTPWAPNVHVKEPKELSYEAWSKEEEHFAPKRNGSQLKKRSEGNFEIVVLVLFYSYFSIVLITVLAFV
ncbi:unnamed protein product [Bursaphelenchus xylophilus]|uniref:(pine wood nematode) hypothetical protein n=1 Tax=Bursaphelenchus xylophilus TaxID=6326 RepID=A0A1I7RM14_BURXY|nr:unnamed protein product [Bursaphelenchus xylophilus]CAG9118108.1 unnamed protein product [Bursaphelenchus xylophilus]